MAGHVSLVLGNQPVRLEVGGSNVTALTPLVDPESRAVLLDVGEATRGMRLLRLDPDSEYSEMHRITECCLPRSGDRLVLIQGDQCNPLGRVQ